MNIKEARTVKIGDTLTDIELAGHDYVVTDIQDLKGRVLFIGILILDRGRLSTVRTNRQVNLKT